MVIKMSTLDRKTAVAELLGCSVDDVVEGYGDNTFKEGSHEYRVLTDTEADKALEEALDSILDDVILPDLDEALHCYFDRDAWKRDAQDDGRGHHLNHYNGVEDEVQVNGGWYYLYRTS